ncbi:hypothetical protein HaLaN_05223 [Haematococcus lacustris]|uniref:Uncharacterized protein n=1 Tax=Haematococcus lacustris TaxID=44745 RepID=A0A699YIG6_HAELA|nr:hypothetical protein HaLaN_05223 [Haematococcus lacustris]
MQQQLHACMPVPARAVGKECFSLDKAQIVRKLFRAADTSPCLLGRHTDPVLQAQRLLLHIAPSLPPGS